jgi:hypothetical protein
MAYKIIKRNPMKVINPMVRARVNGEFPRRSLKMKNAIGAAIRTQTASIRRSPMIAAVAPPNFIPSLFNKKMRSGSPPIRPGVINERKRFAITILVDSRRPIWRFLSIPLVNTCKRYPQRIQEKMFRSIARRKYSYRMGVWVR